VNGEALAHWAAVCAKKKIVRVGKSKRMKWAVHVRILVGKRGLILHSTPDILPFGRLARVCNDNIKMVLKKMWTVVGWIYLAQNWYCCWVPYNAGTTLTLFGTIRLRIT
jgi:hypothetical protein